MIRPLRAACLVVAIAVLPCGGCSVAANLSADEILSEVDALVRIEGSRPDYVVRYVDRAETSSLLRRLLYFGAWVLLESLGSLFDNDDPEGGEDELDLTRRAVDDRLDEQSEGGQLIASVPQPVNHVRILLLELPDEVGDDLRFAGLAASRCGWLAHYDVHPLSRVVALDCLCRLAAALELPLFQGDLRRFRFAPPGDDVVTACGRVRDGRPKRGATSPGDDAARAVYVEALAACVAAPLAEPHARIALVEVLTDAFLAERDEQVRERTGAALRTALAHLTEWLLIDLVQGRGADVDVRLCAMEQVRRAGGPAAVPFLLAVMVAAPERMARGEPAYDPDPDVRLRLIHYCGQLRAELGTQTLTLEGRKGTVPLSPLDFLAVTALNESAYTSKLRVPAMTAMAWSLGRPRLDFDIAWIREWRAGRQ
ncbi:MAG: hypothetical protein ACK6D1_02970 [Planctomycetota bacterium]